MCQAGDGGWAVGCLWQGSLRLMGFRSITRSKSGHGRESEWRQGDSGVQGLDRAEMERQEWRHRREGD